MRSKRCAVQNQGITLNTSLEYLSMSPGHDTVCKACGAKFFRFSSDPQNKFPQTEITANIFPSKLSSRVNILQLKCATRKYCTKKSCLFNHNLSLSFRNKTVYNEVLVYCLKRCISIKYSIKTKILPMLGTGYFLKIPKINCQQEKPICPNRKNQFPQNTENRQSAKISCHTLSLKRS